MFRVILSLRPKLVAEGAFLCLEIVVQGNVFCAETKGSCLALSFVLLYSCSVNSLLCLKTTLTIVKIISQ